MKKYVSDLTSKQKDHLCRIYLWEKHNVRPFYWGEDGSFSERTIISLVHNSLLYTTSEWSVRPTVIGNFLGHAVFVRTKVYDQLDRDYENDPL